MTVEQLISQYGYAALFLGACLEGETFLLIAGFAAHRGYIALHWVWLVAFAGSTFADQVWFHLGRWRGPPLMERRPSWRRGAERIRPWLARNQNAVVLGFRFVPGTRTVTPILLGATSFSVKKFIILNTIGAAVWTLVIGSAGYLCGEVLEQVVEQAQRYERLVMLCLAAIGGAAWTIRRMRASLAASRAARLSRPHSAKDDGRELL